MISITLTDAQLASIAQQQAAVSSAVPNVPVIVPTPAPTIAPIASGFDGPVAAQSIAWAPGVNRILSAGFAGNVIWHVGLTTGGPSSRPARLQAAEYNSQPVPRQWALVRVSDGLTVASGRDSPTFTVWMSVVNPIYGPTLMANTDYMLFVRNQNGDGGQMSLDLIL